ncbi:carboxylesterase family protein [Crossiella sp. SN42]|uniref:carboxylesterase/lipase family protein n=1 Tax=Crossiella sp. SN42 TaxID=2944808 RepID=UPI00207D0C1E|nr:carboxylesterase family protein [Crossiella sp. SN42]MCO1574369.1 carboxylesterase family protein [Crossiella sp. SN42]
MITKLLLTITTLAGVTVGPPHDPALARTDAGVVRGTVNADHRSFQGIPFAAPPTGRLRWQPPRPVAPWPGIRAATAPGSICAQGVPGQKPLSVNEDCLYLNVTTPTTPGPHPVLVWLHGGAFTLGGGSYYDPARMVASGRVVVVTVNYRLGVFGYFGHPGLGRDSGSYGLLDQLAALHWVRRNASAFGGDPTAVTVAGESAGGLSACAMLTTPAAAGLFQRAIIQSGSCAMDWPANGTAPGVRPGSPFLSTERVQAQGAALAAARGCPTVDCLREPSAADLLAEPLAAGFTHLAYGGPVLTERPVEALRKGHVLPVPVLIGHTRDEGRLFGSFFARPGTEQTITEAHYRELAATAFGTQAGRVLARYPVAAHGSPIAAWSDAMTDRVWACPTLETARLLRAVTPTHSFEFADRTAPSLLPPPKDLPLGAYHGAELPYLFDSPGVLPALTAPAQHALSAEMLRHWTAFARGERLPWPQVPAVRQLGRPATNPAVEHQCGFWAGVAG